MPDRRVVDDLTIEELEQVLRIKKREARLQGLRRMERAGRRPNDLPLAEDRQQQDDPEEVERLAYQSFLTGDDPDSLRERTRRDRLLLTVELGAAITLVGVLVFAALSLRDINQEAAQAQEEQVNALPTPTATPIISVVVLPGGHTPPTALEDAQPNYDEAPEYLRPLVEQQFLGPAILPTPGPSAAIRIRIPGIDVDAPIVQGDTWEQLKKGVAQHLGSADPGRNGNLVLSAHNDIYGQLFRRLDELREGDEIRVSTQTQEFVYEVLHWRVVEPTDVTVLDQTPDPVITLISCYPYLVNTHRIVVVGKLATP